MPHHPPHRVSDRAPRLGVGGDEYWLGVQSAQREHSAPGTWASPEFIRGFRDWRRFRVPEVVLHGSVE